MARDFLYFHMREFFAGMIRLILTLLVISGVVITLPLVVILVAMLAAFPLETQKESDNAETIEGH